MNTIDRSRIVGTAEILERHGIPRHRVLRFLNRGLWPQPVAHLRAGMVFDEDEVVRAVANLRAAGKL
jgi:hypothetical protein